MSRVIQTDRSAVSGGRKSYLFISVVISIIVSFCLLEGMTRVFVEEHFDNVLLKANNSLHTYNAANGWLLTPETNQRFRTVDNHVITYEINAHGFRSPAFISPDPELLVVGDSITFGSNADTTYAREFARLTAMETVNGGVPGYGTDQAFLMTRRAIEDLGLRPRRVVYGFFYNDLENNVARRNIHSKFRINKPILNLDSGKYEPANVRENEISGKLYRSFGGLLKDLLKYSKLLRMSVVGFRKASRLILGARAQQERAGIAAKKVRYLLANLDSFRSYLIARNIEFIIFHIPSRADLVRSRLDDDLEKLLRDYGRSRGVRYIRADLSDDDYLKLDGHLSAKGAQSAAEALANGLNISIDGPASAR